MSNIFVTIVRTGKQQVTVTTEPGVSVREVFEQANIGSDVYGTWSITDEAGDSLNLDSQLHGTTALVCGARTDGA